MTLFFCTECKDKLEAHKHYEKNLKRNAKVKYIKNLNVSEV